MWHGSTHLLFDHACPDQEWGRGRESGSHPPHKSQVVIGFFKNTGTDPLEKQLDTLCAIVSDGRSVQLSVKYFMSRPPLTHNFLNPRMYTESCSGPSCHSGGFENCVFFTEPKCTCKAKLSAWVQKYNVS